MADEEYTGPSPLSLLRSEEITGKKPGNLVGLDKGDIQKYLDAQQGFIKSLEDRYEQPNLFKIAAGFAKPQLGGFLASLGSAAQAMGEQQEKQRDIQLPLYKARSELAALENTWKQKGMAAAKLEKAARAGRTLTPSEGMETTALEEGPTAGARAGSEMQGSQATQILNALSSSRSQAEFEAKLGPNFTTSAVADFFKNHPMVMPPVWMNGDPKTTQAGQPVDIKGSTQAPVAVQGIPEGLASGLTRDQQIQATSQQVLDRTKRADELNRTLGQQATAAVPIYEAAVSLYELATKPTLKPVFSIFEKGDPMGIIGKAMEDQSLSSVLAKARDQIIHARYGSKAERDQALSDFHAFENALNALNMSVMASASAGIQNPTDMVRRAEVSSVPGIKSTRDAFLRGIARLGSDAMSKYETKNALSDYLKMPNADINNWEGSNHYKDVMQNTQKRQTDLLNNTASTELPAFMRKGISGAHQYKSEKFDLKEAVKRRLAELSQSNKKAP